MRTLRPLTVRGRVSLVLVLVGVASGLLAAPVHAQESCPLDFQSVSEPLTELGPREYVRLRDGPTGFTGGLYPGGINSRPPAHEAAGLAAAGQIVPLDAAGQASSTGKIVLISVGMSNTEAEFGQFQQRVFHNPQVNPHLLLLNGAQGGRTAEQWADPHAPAWQQLDNRLAKAKVTPQQVQVAWVKQTLTRGGDFPEKAQTLQADLESIARNLKSRYPNLRIAYFSSRTRSYTYWRGLSPEPNAFETGFAVKWMIEKQIDGDPSLNFDPAQGQVVAPFLAWGPYLWADGENARLDGLVWTQEDMASDCTHPTLRGASKVADQLLAFFTTDTTAGGWFLAAPAAATPAGEATAALLPSEPARAASVPAQTSAVQPAETATQSVSGVQASGPSFAAVLADGRAMAALQTAALLALVTLVASAGISWLWIFYRQD